jgi:hypothetical protein
MIARRTVPRRPAHPEHELRRHNVGARALVDRLTHAAITAGVERTRLSRTAIGVYVARRIAGSRWRACKAGGLSLTAVTVPVDAAGHIVPTSSAARTALAFAGNASAGAALVEVSFCTSVERMGDIPMYHMRRSCSSLSASLHM